MIEADFGLVEVRGALGGFCEFMIPDHTSEDWSMVTVSFVSLIMSGGER